MAFVVLYAVTLVVNIMINSAVIETVGTGLSVLAFLVATGTTTILNFLGMRLVAFRAGIHNRLATELQARVIGRVRRSPRCSAFPRKNSRTGIVMQRSHIVSTPWPSSQQFRRSRASKSTCEIRATG